MFSKTRTENKHEAQGRKIRLFLSSVLTFGNREGLGKFFWATKHLKTSLFAKSKSDSEVAHKRTLASLAPLPFLSLSILSSLSTTHYIKMPALFNVKEMEAPESLPNNKVMEVSQGRAAMRRRDHQLHHQGQDQDSHQQVSVFVPLNCQECV